MPARLLLPLSLALSVLAFAPAPAAAARSYDNCKYVVASLPAVITSPGVWCLQGDLATSITSGAAISIKTANVTLDCNDFKIGGLSAGRATRTIGIRLEGGASTTVRNCNVRGFFVAISGAAPTAPYSALIEDNRIEGSLLYGVRLDGDAHVVRRNLILDTGGSTAVNATEPRAISIAAGDGAIVDDNVVNGVQRTASEVSQRIVGIDVIGGTGVALRGNRVAGLSRNPGDPLMGINLWGVNQGIVRDNDLFGDGDTGDGTAISCQYARVLTKDNAIAEFATELGYGCYYFDNGAMLAGDTSPND